MSNSTTVDHIFRARAKLYKLDMDGNWKDQGTGNCVCQAKCEGSYMCLYFQHISEVEKKLLIEHRIQKSGDYRRQGKNILTFCDNSTEYALSFEKPNEAQKFWSHIEQFRGSIDGKISSADRLQLLLNAQIKQQEQILKDLSLMIPAIRDAVARLSVLLESAQTILGTNSCVASSADRRC
eukprot:TRINITY_DN3136_c0_g1_i1.p1 TRINITY_DN3136_c0_g1~~TRINITY_DN3136_c0_g1_i1.p1  ORF type:complete len:180 (+),score=19.28 TRINITY_DN3136_c0_g1_i1:212-751(+)